MYLMYVLIVLLDVKENDCCTLGCIELMLTELCNDCRINPEGIQGWANLQPICHTPLPSIHLVSSSGIPMDMLAVSNMHSNTSSHSSRASKHWKKASKWTC